MDHTNTCTVGAAANMLNWDMNFVDQYMQNCSWRIKRKLLCFGFCLVFSAWHACKFKSVLSHFTNHLCHPFSFLAAAPQTVFYLLSLPNYSERDATIISFFYRRPAEIYTYFIWIKSQSAWKIGIKLVIKLNGVSLESLKSN